MDKERLEGVDVGFAGEIIEGGETINSGSRLEPNSRTLNPEDLQEAYRVSSSCSDDSSLMGSFAGSLKVDSWNLLELN